jgi:three-Cys-motif partner protein
MLKIDEIGYWSEIKLDIVREYAKAYSRILTGQKQPSLYHVYIDAFAGAGIHKSKTTGNDIEGSPLIAVKTQPPFKEYHFIDVDADRIEQLRSLIGERSDVQFHPGDCNQILMQDVFPKVRWEQYRRGLCLLDPYGLDLKWEVIRTAGSLKTIDLFLNFPIMDMNRNVFWRHPKGEGEGDISRMNNFWGDNSWRNAAYQKVQTLFEPEDEKTDNETIAEAFRQRLLKVAGFENVPKPIPMRNSNNATAYYLFFASQKPVAQNIVTAIFARYRDRRAP